MTVTIKRSFDVFVGVCAGGKKSRFFIEKKLKKRISTFVVLENPGKMEGDVG